MKISFYEEFPTKENLDKIRLIKFPTRLIVAAKSLNEFNSIKNRITEYNNKNIKEVIYWPVLEKDEGYWLSALSKNSGLKRIIDELKQNEKPLTIMWDAELPFYKAPTYKYLFNYFIYFQNRRIILNFFKNAKNYNIKILTSEYPLQSKFFRNLLFGLFLISFDPKKYGNKKIAMLYTSLIKNRPSIESFLEKQIKLGKEYFGDDFMVALGTITLGVNGNEPILSPDELGRDLKIAKKNKISEVVIFRLGGVNAKYVNVIKKYI